MKKPSRKTKPAKTGALVVVPSRAPAHESSFREVVSLIQRARQRAFQAVNTELIDLYWRVGEFISRKLETAEWGDGVVDELARYLARQHPDLKGFTRRNLFRMRQFYGIYHLNKKVAPLVRQLPWTHNLLILSRSKRPEEREFYLRLCLRERWSKRELERQLAGALFERTVLSPPKVSPLVTQIHPAAETIFKDTYLLDFLDLPEVHSEADLQAGLVAKDHEVVEYALARSVSPALIAEYQTALPDKQLLRRKLHEFYQLARPHAAPAPRKPDIGSRAKETAVPSRNMGKPARS